MMALVERLVIGSGAGASAVSFLTSLPVSGVSATKLFLRSPLPTSDVEPRRGPRHQYVEEQAADEEDEADHERAEDRLPRVEVQKRQAPAGDDLVKVAVAVEHDGVVIPRLPRPEPNPTGPAYESADEDED